MKNFNNLLIFLIICINCIQIKADNEGVKTRVKGIKNNIFLSKIIELNDTKSSSPVSSGVCYKEVPAEQVLKTIPKGFTPRTNGTKPGYYKIQVCCDGYTRKAHTFQSCEPICEYNCINANCTGPNICTCYPNYVLDQGNNCVPTCPIGCLNGLCKPNTDQCICHPGFKLDPRGKICVPECKDNCQNGNCTAPGVCECLTGFRKDENNQCNYHCEGGCEANEECVGPNKCACRKGYAIKNDNKCEPQCDKGCEIGSICTGPDTCTCLAGFSLDANGIKCVPDCTKRCLNGHCIGPDKCDCNRGYIKDPNTWYKCTAHCPNGCLNGVCSAPNFCICNAGYVKDSGVKGGHSCVSRLRRSIFNELIPKQII